jgi:hypothetical protein
VKALLIQKLEDARDKILPILDTTQGMQSLEHAYFTVIGRRRMPAEDLLPTPLPPQATVEFYLNRPNDHAMRNRLRFGGFRGIEARED